jgi:hypothetical protein
MASNTHFYTQQSITNTVDALAVAKTAAQQYSQALATPLSTPPTTAELANLQQAYAFFQAMENKGSFTTSDGTTINFSQYGSGGIFGSQTATFEAALNKVLSDYGNTVKIPSPDGGTATVIDTTTGQPATLADIIANPSHTFSFSFSNDVDQYQFMPGNSNPTPWCQGSFYSAFMKGNGSGSITTDSNGKTIPGGGLNFNYVDHSSACSSSSEVSVSGSGQALLNYLDISQTGTSSTLNLDGGALSQFLNQNM